jgi:hypothetical protein
MRDAGLGFASRSMHRSSPYCEGVPCLVPLCAVNKGMCGKASVGFGGYVCLHAPLGSLQFGSALHAD